MLLYCGKDPVKANIIVPVLHALKSIRVRSIVQTVDYKV